jgi:purine-binding chemotaxis protein CheW
MKNKQYLTFRLHNLQYGIEAALVQELFPLPELTPIAEVNNEIVGVLNLRGQIVPMIHLDLLQEHPLKDFQISDHVIIMQYEGLQIGVVAHHINEVLELNPEIIELEPSSELTCDINAEFIAGVAKRDEGNILLLESKRLTSQLDDILPLIWDVQMQLDVAASSSASIVEEPLEQEGQNQQDEEFQTTEVIASFYDLYCPNATPEERAIFRQRADELKHLVESSKAITKLMPLAVIGFDNNYFGLDLELVRELTDISNLTPIPCCPTHIIGNMNLRGEIVTLVDIRNVLNLPLTPVSVGSKAVVVQVDDIVAGLPVDQVLEMVELNPADLTPLSGILSDSGEQYFRGTTLFEEKMLTVLDLPKIFMQGTLAVNEEA